MTAIEVLSELRERVETCRKKALEGWWYGGAEAFEQVEYLIDDKIKRLKEEKDGDGDGGGAA